MANISPAFYHRVSCVSYSVAFVRSAKLSLSLGVNQTRGTEGSLTAMLNDPTCRQPPLLFSNRQTEISDVVSLKRDPLRRLAFASEWLKR